MLSQEQRDVLTDMHPFMDTLPTIRASGSAGENIADGFERLLRHLATARLQRNAAIRAAEIAIATDDLIYSLRTKQTMMDDARKELAQAKEQP